MLLNVGQANFERRFGDLGLTETAVAEATSALNRVLLADAATSRTAAPPPILEAGLLAAYHEAYTVGVAVALLLAGGVCLLMALAWLALEPRPSGSPGRTTQRWPSSSESCLPRWPAALSPPAALGI